MRRISGFTLIELMIVLAIIAVLSALGLASYSFFTDRAVYTEVVLSAQGYKRAVDICVLSHPISACDLGTNGIASSISSQAVLSVALEDGVITVTPRNYLGITTSDVYVLTPSGGGDGQRVQAWTDNCGSSDYC